MQGNRGLPRPPCRKALGLPRQAHVRARRMRMWPISLSRRWFCRFKIRKKNSSDVRLKSTGTRESTQQRNSGFQSEPCTVKSRNTT